MSFELLADHLEPRFGNIYEYNLDDGLAGYDVQEWTDELRDAVRQYLLHELPSDIYGWLFRHETDPSRTKESLVDQLLEDHEPWEVAYAVRKATVAAVPTLDQLIGNLPAWQDADQQEDAATWLDAHASQEQLVELAEYTNHPERNPETHWYVPEPTGEPFTQTLEPAQLLNAWHHVVGPAESDLTENEWQLLVHVLPEHGNRYGSRPRSEQELRTLRAALDGMRYKFTHDDLPWLKIPWRYGRAANIYKRYMNYKVAGHFARMLDALAGKPGAKRVEDWLDRMRSGSAS